MRHAEDASAKIPQDAPHDGRRQGAQIPRRLIEQQHVGFIQHHLQKEKLGALTAGECADGAAHFIPREFCIARPDARHVVLPTGGRKEINRRF